MCDGKFYFTGICMVNIINMRYLYANLLEGGVFWIKQICCIIYRRIFESHPI